MIGIKNLIYQAKKSRILNDSFWAVFGNVLGKGLSLSAAILIGRFLGKDIYGEYGIIMGTIGSIAIFSNFGLNFTSTKYIAELKNSEPELLPKLINKCEKITLTLGGISALFLYILAEYISIYVLESPTLTLPLRIMSISVAINSINRTQIGILAGLGKFKSLSKISTLIGTLTFTLGVSATYSFGITGAFLAVIIIGITNYFLNLYQIKKFTKTIIENSKKEVSFSELFKFSLPVAIQEAVYSLLAYTYGLLLVKYSTFGEVGLNAAVAYWSSLILFIPGILRNVVLSHLSANLADKKKRLKILRLVLLFNFSVTLIVSILVFLLSDFIGKAYGNNFTGLINVLNISVFTTIFISMSNVYAQAYMSENKNWLMLLFRAIRDISILVITFYLIQINQGVNGALTLAKSVLWSNIFFLFLMAGVYELKFSRQTT